MPYVTGVKDLDAIPNVFCLFKTDDSPAGCPDNAGAWFAGLQFKLNSKWMTQVVVAIGSTTIYTRSINNGNLYGWARITAS